MMLFLLLLVALVGVHSSWSRHPFSIAENVPANTIHTIPLGSEATFNWKCVFEQDCLGCCNHRIFQHQIFQGGFNERVGRRRDSLHRQR